MELIDKSALVAEIERKIKETEEHWKSPYGIETATGRGILMGYRDILSLLDTFEVKEVQEEPISEDLENEIQRYYVDWDEHPQYVQTARHFAKWQKEQMMKDGR